MSPTRAAATSALTIVALLAAAPWAGAQAGGEETFVAVLRGEHEVPPRETPASGLATVIVAADRESLSFRLVVENIENLVQAHIHVGAIDENGPVVAFLFGPEPPGGGLTERRVFEGTLTQDDLVGPLAGQPFSDLLDAIASGNAYVNVHTDDGQDPAATGPGDFPGGEVRGQLVAACADAVTATPRQDGSILLVWETVPLAEEFQVFRRDVDAAGFELVATVDAPDTSFLDEEPEPGETFDYVVQVSSGLLEERHCEETLSVTAIPYFPAPLVAGLALSAGVVAYARMRRK